MRIIAFHGSEYLAAGDVHGVSKRYIPKLRKVFGENFSTAVLVRDPLQRIKSHQSHIKAYRGYHPAWLNTDHIDTIIDRKGLNINKNDTVKKVFVHSVNMLNAVTEEAKIGRIFKFEDFTRNPETLGELVREITKKKIDPDIQWLTTAIGTSKTNIHNLTKKPIQFSDWQIEVFNKVVLESAWRIYKNLGYCIPDFI